MAQQLPKKPSKYVPYQIDKEQSMFVLVVYRHANPSFGSNYYSKYIEDTRTADEQLDAMVSLMIRFQREARTMILYQNNKKGTGRESDLPANIEYVRVHHGHTLDFARSGLDSASIQYLRSRLQPLERWQTKSNC